MIHGLQYDLASLQIRRRNTQAVLDSADSGPRRRHDAEVDAKKLDAEILTLINTILETQELIAEIQGILNQLHVSKVKSHNRSLVKTELENAQSRLLRELGDKPAI